MKNCLTQKKSKKKILREKNKRLILESTIIYNNQEITLKIESTFDWKEVKTKKINYDKDLKKFIKKVNLVYIPSDRKINKDNKENWYMKLIDLILKK